MRHRLFWRIAAVVSALAIALPMTLVNVHPTFAQGPGTMVWTGSIWRDPVCGTSGQQFDIRLYQHADYQGTTWRLCSTYTDFCWAPYGEDSSDAVTCALGYDGDTINDRASSMKLVDVGGGSSCYVDLREHRNHQGASYKRWDPVWVSSFVPWPNDVISSLRRVC